MSHEGESKRVASRLSPPECRWLFGARRGSSTRRGCGRRPPSSGCQLFFFCGLRSSEIHPLNLSISISGGRETNRDSPSNGERSGNTPVPRSEISDRTDCAVGELWSGERSCPGVAFPGPEVDLERRAQEGESPVGPRNRERRDESWRSSSRVVWECSSNRVVDSIQG